MNKKLAGTLGLLCIAVAFAMYMVGNKSSHLSELKDFWWAPVPLGVLLILYVINKKQ
jgi:hypothetical protein